jgi:hypothetical protein
VIFGAMWAVDLWLPPVLAAVAAVGLTRLTAGVERRAWERDARRDVYARFLATSTTVWHTKIEIEKRREHGTGAEPPVMLEVAKAVQEASSRLLVEMTALSGAVAELRLYASEELMAEAVRAQQTLLRSATADLPKGEHWLDNVVRLMRADLEVRSRRPGRLGGGRATPG